MEKIPRLTKQNINISKGTKVILFGSVFKQIVLVYQIFNYLGIEVVGVYAEEHQYYLQFKVLGIPTISSSKLEKIKKRYNKILVQSTDTSYEAIEGTIRKATEMGFKVTEWQGGEIISSFANIIILNTVRHPIKSRIMKLYWRHLCNQKSEKYWRKFIKERHNEPVLICMPTKTADNSLMNTLRKAKNEGYNIDFENSWHRPKFINKNRYENKYDKLKIITSVREPIGQNLSAFYQQLSGGALFSYNWIYGELEHQTKIEKNRILDKYEKLSKFYGNDVQMMWDEYVERFICHHNDCWKASVRPNVIQKFIPEFNKYVVNLLSYPFDKENGYTIIREGKTEIFVYQLEKLNDIVPELSTWLGIPFDHLEKGNLGEDKWIGESYKEAKECIKINSRYFETCFNEPYVHHFYSEKDIDEFKEKWQSNISRE